MNEEKLASALARLEVIRAEKAAASWVIAAPSPLTDQMFLLDVPVDEIVPAGVVCSLPQSDQQIAEDYVAVFKALNPDFDIDLIFDGDTPAWVVTKKRAGIPS